MKFLEYLYLLAGIGMAVAYALFNTKIEGLGSIPLLVGAVIFTFLYSFRRRQRIALEEMERKQNSSPKTDPPHDHAD